MERGLTHQVAAHEDLRDAVRSFLDKHAPIEHTIATMELPGGHDPAVWRALCRDIGVGELGIPEELGGCGGDLAARTVVMEEFGRVVLGGPHLALTLAVTWLTGAGTSDAQGRLLPGLASGEQVPGFAVGRTPTRTRAAWQEGHWVLDGPVGPVVDGTIDSMLVLGRTPDGLRLFETTGPGVVRAPARVPLDLTRPLSWVGLQAASAVPVTEVLDDREEAAVRRDCRLLLAAEQVGGGLATLERSIDHARSRRQFGRTIGSFQAVKHRLVDAFLGVEAVRAWCYAAVGRAAGGMTDPRDRAESVGLAATASSAYVAAARTAIQVHGGIGFTWEHPAHVYLKRAKAGEIYLGTTRGHLAEVARHLREDGAGGRVSTP